MKSKRRRHDAAFKAMVALEAIKGARTIQEIAKEYDLHPVQITGWKKQMQAGASQVFAGGKPDVSGADQEREKDRLHSKIGELTVCVDFLKKKCKQVGIAID